MLRNIIVLQTNWTSDSEDLNGFWGLPYPVVVGQQVVVKHSFFSTGLWKGGGWLIRKKDDLYLILLLNESFGEREFEQAFSLNKL